MLWQLFPICTIGVVGGLAFIFIACLLIEHFDSYYGIDKRKKRKLVFWGLKFLEFSALMFVIETAVNLMRFGTAGGFFHTTAKMAFSIILPVVVLMLITVVAWVLVLICKGFVTIIKKTRIDISGTIRRILGFVKKLWAKFIQTNKDYAEIIAEQGIIYSVIHADMLKWEVAWKRRKKLEEERAREKERKEMSERTRQAEKELNDAMAIAEGRKIKLWYPLGDNDEV